MTGRRLVAALAAAVVLVAPATAAAGWIDLTTATAAYSAALLAPPTSPGAGAGQCTVLVGDRTVVSWTATTSVRADGYKVYRSSTSGGPYALVGTVAGRATTSFVDGPLPFSTTYHYVVRATKVLWTSLPTGQVSRTTKLVACL